MATIKDIAKMAGVSTSTVSHVVNKTRFVSPELAERVEKAIQELDHPPNFVIKKHLTPTISRNAGKPYILLMISDSKSSFQRQVMEDIKHDISAAPYILVPIEYSADRRCLDIISDYMSGSNQPSGVLAFPDDDDTIQYFLEQFPKLPAVLIGRAIPGLVKPAIISGSHEGGYKAACHFIKNGHEQLACLSTSDRSESGRLAGFIQAMNDNHIPINENNIFTNLKQTKDIYRALDFLFSQMPAPTAVLAANYPLAIPLLNYLETHNIRCPQDISVIIFNEFDWAGLHTPPLSTIDQNSTATANKAVQLLLDQIAACKDDTQAPLPLSEPKPSSTTITIPCRLNIRASTCGIGRGPFGEKAESAELLALTPAEEQLLQKKNYTAVISFHYTGRAWMALHEKGIRNIFDRLGIALIAVTDAHFNPELQVKQLASLSLLDPDILIAMPTDNKKTAQAFKKASHTHSKLVLIANVPEGLTPGDYVSCISVNERSQGQNMGRALGEYMQKQQLKNIGIIRHSADFYATSQRDLAAIHVLTEEYPMLNICGIVQFTAEAEVYEQTTQLLREHPEIEALYISWEGPAAEAMSALTALSRTDIAIITGDLDYDAALNMAKGGMIKAISAQCPYEQGQAIALAAANALLGKTTPSFIGIEPQIVTAENLLKSWSNIYKEEAPEEIKQAIRENPNSSYLPQP